MELIIKRSPKKLKTPGEMFWYKQHFGWTLEDPERDLNGDGSISATEKVYGDTAIARGRYILRLTYSNKFKKILPQLFNVPGGKINFGNSSVDVRGLRIHGLNNKTQTLGCPGLGANRKPNLDIYNCAAINKKLIRLMRECKKRGESVYLTIK